MALWSGENAPRREEMVLGTVRTVLSAGFRVYQTKDSDRTNILIRAAQDVKC